MARRKKRTPIPVEVSQFANDERHVLERLNGAAQRLIRYSPERLDRLVALAHAWCSSFEQNGESEDMHQARLRRIAGQTECN